MPLLAASSRSCCQRARSTSIGSSTVFGVVSSGVLLLLIVVKWRSDCSSLARQCSDILMGICIPIYALGNEPAYRDRIPPNNAGTTCVASLRAAGGDSPSLSPSSRPPVNPDQYLVILPVISVSVRTAILHLSGPVSMLRLNIRIFSCHSILVSYLFCNQLSIRNYHTLSSVH